MLMLTWQLLFILHDHPMIFVDEGLTPLQVEERRTLLQQRKTACKEGKWVLVHDGRLLVVRCRNCNGTLCIRPKELCRVIHRTRHYLLHRDTSESGHPLLIVSGYTRESVYCEETRETGGVWGSGGVAILYRSNLIRKISIEREDIHSCFLLHV